MSQIPQYRERLQAMIFKLHFFEKLDEVKPVRTVLLLLLLLLLLLFTMIGPKLNYTCVTRAARESEIKKDF